jgi:hypothetical protein
MLDIKLTETHIFLFKLIDKLLLSYVILFKNIQLNLLIFSINMGFLF